MTRPAKKSETLEIRLPHEAKTAFMSRCQARGLTASQAVRGFIYGEIGPRRLVRLRGWQAVAAAVAGLLIGAVAAPSLAQSSASASRAAFERLDANRDGVVTLVEFQR